MSLPPILYSFRRCPYAMRARLALIVSGAPCVVREVALSNKPPELVALSPKATVPVLALPDGAVIDQSIDIMRWALGRHDPEGWLDVDCTALVDTNDGPFKHALDRYKYPDRHGADPLTHRADALALLRELEARLEGRANLCRDTRSLADMALMPFIRQFAATDADWFAAQPLPRLQAWLAVHLASPLFARAMQRLAPWRPGEDVVML